MGIAQKVKGLFVEPYTPLLDRGYLRMNKNRINWIAASVYVAIIVLVTFAIVTDPFIAFFLIFPMTAIGVILEEDARGLILIRKKRGRLIYIPYNCNWHSAEIAEYDAGYRKKLIEYLDFLRLGEEQNDSIEEHVNQWRIEAERAKNKELDRNAKITASSFINEDELREYREFRKKYDQLVKEFNY